MSKKDIFSPHAMGISPYQMHLNLIDFLQTSIDWWHKFYMSPGDDTKDAQFAAEFPGMIYNTRLLSGLSNGDFSQKLDVSTETIERYIAKMTVPRIPTRTKFMSRLTEILIVSKNILQNAIKHNQPPSWPTAEPM